MSFSGTQEGQAHLIVSNKAPRNNVTAKKISTIFNFVLRESKKKYTLRGASNEYLQHYVLWRKQRYNRTSMAQTSNGTIKICSR